MRKTILKDSLPTHPSWTEDQNREDLVSVFQKHGYFIVRNLISEVEISSTKQEISLIISDWWKKLEEQRDWQGKEIANRLVCFGRSGSEPRPRVVGSPSIQASCD